MSKFVLKEDKPPIRLPVVLIIQMHFNLGRFGLVENMRRKGTLIVSESRLRKIISESIRKVLYN